MLTYGEMNQSTLNLTFLEKEARRFKVKVGVLLFLTQNDEVLLLRRFQTGIDDGMYVVPMGGLKPDETVSQAMIREAEEETGVLLNPSQLEVCHVMHRLHQMPDGYAFTQIDVFFRADQWEGTIVNNEPDKCDELKFFPIKALPEATVPCIAHAIQCIQNNAFFSEFGWS